LVVVTSGSLDFGDGESEWRPEREYFCRRKGAWLGDFGTEVENRFHGMS